MDNAAIESLITPVAAGLHLEVDRLEVLSAGKRSVIRIFLDGDGAAGLGPSLDEIADATKAISTALDDADFSNGRPYILEVSSPGVNRPLTQAKHYRRNRGRLVRCALTDGEVTGRIVAVTDAEVVLDVAGVQREVSLADIRKANVQVELNRPVPDEMSEEEA